MKLWTKSNNTDQLINEFTVGSDRVIDLHLAQYDVTGSIAHAKMLAACGLITDSECVSLVHALEEILTEIHNGRFTIPDTFEDVHSRVEFLLTEKLGEPGKKIHTARSRNDQSLLDIKLYLRHELKQIRTQIVSLTETLLTLAEQHKNELLPGYTHYQLAMPSSFGLWFGAYAESLMDDLLFIDMSINFADKNPLGSAAGYGSSFPIDRNITTQELGFAGMNINSVYAQMTRGKTEKAAASAIASAGSTLNKLASDITLFMNQEFNYVAFPDSITTGSSIMPHKKNPDVWELIRAKANKLQSVPNELALMLTNLPSGYHRDFQLTKEIIINSVITLQQMLAVTEHCVAQIQVRKNILENEKYDTLYTVDAVNNQVVNGVPFRDAYMNISEKVKSGTFKRPADIPHTHIGSIGNPGINEIRARLTRSTPCRLPASKTCHQNTKS
jgi:argininosuccinate lyase